MNAQIQRHFLESLQNLWLYKLRSLLTLLGILVGTASVVALVSSGELATQHALSQFKALGTELFAITIESQGVSTDANPRNLTLEDVETLKKSSPDILVAAPYTTDYSPISALGKMIPGNTVGATKELADIVKIKLASGRFVSILDQKQYFCVVGATIANTLRQNGMFHLIGQQIRVGNNFFTIVGIAKPWAENMFMYADLNQAIMIPITASFTLGKYAHIQNILFQLRTGADVFAVQKTLEMAVQRIIPNAKVFSRSAKELIESMQKQRQTFTLLLSAIGGISLLVGGIGVMNIMLVSVIERRREIGIRMAIGARRRDIQMMFLVEAVVLSLIGGIVGIIIGELVSLIISLFSHWPFSIYGTPVFIGFFVSVLVGIFFGFYPAYKASQLDPIHTLRAD